METIVRKGDDTDAFGFEFLTIFVENAEQYTISKAVVSIGTINKEFLNPVFPLRIALSSQETAKLNECRNEVVITIYDSEGKHITLNDKYEFKAAPQLVKHIDTEANNG